MLIPVHMLDTLPSAQLAALVAYSDRTMTPASPPPAALVASICNSGQCATLGSAGTPSSQAPKIPISGLLPPPQAAVAAPLFSWPAADRSDLGLRIKRGVCGAMVAVPFSLYLYFSLFAPRSTRARKPTRTLAPTPIGNIAHDLRKIAQAQ